MSIKKSKVRFQGDREIFKTLKTLKNMKEMKRNRYLLFVKKIFQTFGPTMIYLKEQQQLCRYTVNIASCHREIRR